LLTGGIFSSGVLFVNWQIIEFTDLNMMSVFFHLAYLCQKLLLYSFILKKKHNTSKQY